MQTIELDDDTALILRRIASQQGKTLNAWLKGLAEQFVPEKMDSTKTQGLVAIAKDKGSPLSDDFLAFIQDSDAENPPELTELFGKVPPCFKNAAEVDTFIRAERDAWDD